MTGNNLTYGDATGTTGDFFDGTERLVTLLNRLRILEMPLLFAPNEGWCYVRLSQLVGTAEHVPLLTNAAQIPHAGANCMVILWCVGVLFRRRLHRCLSAYMHKVLIWSFRGYMGHCFSAPVG